MKIFEFYKDILSLGGMNVQDDAVYVDGDDPIPVKPYGKPLVLPTNDMINEHLTRDSMGRVTFDVEFFHPLKEDVIRPESKSLTKLRLSIARVINLRIYALINMLLYKLLEDKKEPYVPFADMMTTFDISNKVKGPLVDTKMIDTIDAVLTNRLTASPTKAFVSFYVKRGGKDKSGEKYNRQATTTYQLSRELEDTTDRTIDGKKLRVKDMQVLTGIVNYVLGVGKDEIVAINRSDSDISPGLDALMGAVLPVISRFNQLLEDFELESNDIVQPFNMDWIDYLENLEAHSVEIDLIPLDGRVLNKEQSNEREDAPASTVPTPGRVTAPPASARPQASSGASGLDPRSLPVDPMQQPQYPHYPQQGYPPQQQGYPQQQYPQTGYPQQGYPPANQGYPPPPAYPPQQGYPPQQQTTYGYQPQQQYPNQPQRALNCY